ncbi:TPA: YkvA family protein [Streptococcus suis]
MKLQIWNESYSLQWKGTYFLALSDYPNIQDWELEKIVAFLAYEKLYGRETLIDCEDKVMLEQLVYLSCCSPTAFPFTPSKKFAAIPGLISMVRSYIRRDYSKLPKATILAIIGALIYFFSPIDALPDFILGAGLLDDAFVLNACLKLIKTDVDDFRSWQASQWKAEE